MKIFAIVVSLSLIASLALPVVTSDPLGDNPLGLLLALCMVNGGGMGGLQGIAPLLLLTNAIGGDGGSLFEGPLGTILLLNTISKPSGLFGAQGMGYSGSATGFGAPGMGYSGVPSGFGSPSMGYPGAAAGFKHPASMMHSKSAMMGMDTSDMIGF